MSPLEPIRRSPGSIRSKAGPPGRRNVALLAVAVAVALPLTGCRTESPPVTPPAERFAACLRDQGVDAIVQGEEVLIAAHGDSVSVGGAGAPPESRTSKPGAQPAPEMGPVDGSVDVEAARVACSRSVPDYRAADHNER